jgi:hypothetical protein
MTEANGQTTLTITASYVSREARDGVLQSGMERGFAESYEVLDELLGTGDAVK